MKQVKCSGATNESMINATLYQLAEFNSMFKEKLGYPCWLFYILFVNLIQLGSSGGGTSIEEFRQIVGKSVGAFSWLIIIYVEGSAHDGWCHPWAVVSGCIKETD